MPRYYPSAKRILLGPVGFTLVVTIPFLKRSAWREIGIVMFAVGFATIFSWWRWFLSAKVADGKLYGRHPEKISSTVLELSEVARVERGEFSLGRIKGWVFHGSSGQAIFVSEPALADPDLRAIFDRHVQPGSAGN